MMVYKPRGLERGIDSFWTAKFEAIFFRSFEVWSDRGVCDGTSEKFFHVFTIGLLSTWRQRKVLNPMSFSIVLQALALERVASILPLFRMIPSF